MKTDAFLSPAAHPLTPGKRRAILLLSFATFCSMATQRVCDPMLPALAQMFTAPMEQAAQVISFFAITYGLMQLVYGPIGERWGKYRVVMLATIGCSLGCLGCALSGDLHTLVIARIATAVAAAGIIPMSLAWVGDAVHYAQRQETLARVGLGTMLGIAGGQLMGGLMSDTLGWRWAFAWLALLYGGVAYLLWRHWHHVRQPVSHGTTTTRFSHQLRQVARDGWARSLLTIALLEGASVFGLLAITASHLHLKHLISLTTAGLTAGLFGLGGMAYMATAKYTIRRWGEAGLALRGGLTLGVSFLVVAFTPWWPLAMPACLVAGFSFAMFHNTMQAKATQMVPTARATGVTLFAGFLFGGQSLGVLLLSQWIAITPSTQVMAWVATGIMVLGWTFSRAIARRNATHADHA